MNTRVFVRLCAIQCVENLKGSVDDKIAKDLNLRNFGKWSMTRWMIVSGTAGACDENLVDLLRARADRASWARGTGRVQARLRRLGRRLGLRGHGEDTEVSK